MPKARQTKKNRSILTAEWMWNWPRTSVEDVGWQDFRSESHFVVTTQVLEDAIHLVMSERLVMRTEENLNLIKTEMRQEHRRLPFASSKQTSEELSVQVELLQESAEVSIVLQHVQHGKMFPVTMFYVGNLLPEEGNKWFDLDKSYGYVHCMKVWLN